MLFELIYRYHRFEGKYCLHLQRYLRVQTALKSRRPPSTIIISYVDHFQVLIHPGVVVVILCFVNSFYYILIFHPGASCFYRVSVTCHRTLRSCNYCYYVLAQRSGGRRVNLAVLWYGFVTGECRQRRAFDTTMTVNVNYFVLLATVFLQQNTLSGQTPRSPKITESNKSFNHSEIVMPILWTKFPYDKLLM